MVASSARALSPRRLENPSSDETFLPSTWAPSSLNEMHSAIPSSEMQYLETHGSEERVALEQRVIAQLRRITNMPIDLGEAKDDSTKAIQLTPEQTRVHQIAVKEQVSMFFTGAAGTGKSILLRRIIGDLKKKYPGRVAVTASTGIAACAIGGRTVHSWAGVGLGKGEKDKILKTVRRSAGAANRWKTTQCLIIDEVSMLSPELLDNLDFVAQRIRKIKKPFGGMQVILTGDFFQLPPVDKDRAERLYAFDAECWQSLIQRTILLTQVFRQRDTSFQNMLNEVRYGKVSAETARNFGMLNRPPPFMPADIIPTRLFSRRAEVDRANNKALAQLDEEALNFDAQDVVYPPPSDHEGRRAPQVDLSKIVWIAPDKVTLKKGAQVMMIKNIDDTLVNGSIGRIIAWVNEPPLPPANMAEKAKNVIDITSMINELHNCSSAKLAKFEKSLAGQGKRAEGTLPLVRFFNRNGTFRDVILQRETWNFENEFGEVIASRTQLPLILAYALSIHKAQGQTLDYVHIDMRSVFEVGQAYVALSRATHIDGLQLVGFNSARVKCDPRVVEFYNGLERVMQPLVVDMFNTRLEKREFAEEAEDPGDQEEPVKSEPDYRDFFHAFRHKRPAPEEIKAEPGDLEMEPALESIVKMQSSPQKPRHGSRGDEEELFVLDIPKYPVIEDMGMPDVEMGDLDPDFDSEFDGDYKFEERSRRFGRG